MSTELKRRKAIPPAPSVEVAAARRRRAGTLRLPPGDAKPAEAAPPQVPNEPINITGGIPSEPMRQAYRDLTNGLQDTGRGAEAGRVYARLKR